MASAPEASLRQVRVATSPVPKPDPLERRAAYLALPPQPTVVSLAHRAPEGQLLPTVRVLDPDEKPTRVIELDVVARNTRR